MENCISNWDFNYHGLSSYELMYFNAVVVGICYETHNFIQNVPGHTVKEITCLCDLPEMMSTDMYYICSSG